VTYEPLLDANVMITAQNLHYGFDFCPGFWNWLPGCTRCRAGDAPPGRCAVRPRIGEL